MAASATNGFFRRCYVDGRSLERAILTVLQREGGGRLTMNSLIERVCWYWRVMDEPSAGSSDFREAWGEIEVGLNHLRGSRLVDFTESDTVGFEAWSTTVLRDDLDETLLDVSISAIVADADGQPVTAAALISRVLQGSHREVPVAGSREYALALDELEASLRRLEEAGLVEWSASPVGIEAWSGVVPHG